ncbi:MAG: Hpt domain-containing protein [Desulfovibrionaceae bacterium]|nr:Hpt domain-containing protein [Desulfovibrionaceae bacterium]
MREIQQAAERGQSILIQEAAGRLAGKAEVFGLVKLGRIAHCVERAAEADDMEAVRTLLEDLGPVVTRYVQSLQECFNAFLYADR